MSLVQFSQIEDHLEFVLCEMKAEWFEHTSIPSTEWQELADVDR